MSSERNSARALVVHYSQSGDVAKTAETVSEAFLAEGIDVVRERLRPVDEFPFPWRRIGRFFNVMPECIYGLAGEIETPEFDADASYDVVVICYPVWFLAPSLPTVSFLRHEKSRVLENTNVVTFVVCRNMWTVASETMKRLLRKRGAVHRDNVAVTHQGPIWATFVSTPRLLLFGKRDRLWNIFPPGGIDEGAVERIRNLGTALAEQVRRGEPAEGAFLSGRGATEVEEKYLLPELIGSWVFRAWGAVLLGLGKIGGNWLRIPAVYLFVFTLVCLIVIGIPILFVFRILAYPILQPWMRKYVARLRRPSDGGQEIDPKKRNADPGGSRDAVSRASSPM